MLHVKVENSSLVFVDEKGNTAVTVAFQRTLRIPDDGRQYPLPPGLGEFPLRKVADYADRVPGKWVAQGGVFLPMYQREAMWLSFGARSWKPNALKVAAGKINAVSGRPWAQALAEPVRGRRGQEDLQDYLALPEQPWLDGFNTGEGTIRQFVAMPLGMGYTVEGQVTGKEEHGGLQLIVYEPRPGLFPDGPPVHARAKCCAMEEADGECTGSMAAPAPMACKAAAPKGAEMGLAAGGTMTQKIYADSRGLSTWDAANFGRVFVHIVNSVMWTEITGEAPPPTPVSPRTYTEHGYPWFKLYDEGQADVPASKVLQKVKSVAQLDVGHGFVGVEDNSPVAIPAGQVKGTGKRNDLDGDW